MTTKTARRKSLKVCRRSRLEAYRDCPRLSKHKDDHPDQTGREALEGQDAHEIMFIYLRHLQRVQRSTDLDYLRRLIREAPGRTSFALAEYMPRFAENFLCPHQHILSLETPYDLPLARNLVFRCTPDGIYLVKGRTLTIDDYKTERWLRTEDQARKSFQARSYSLAVAESLGFSEVTFNFRNMRFNVTQSVDFGPEELEATKNELIALARDMAADKEFRATPGVACQNCPIARDCPAQSETPLDGDPAEFAASLLVRDKALADDKKLLKTWLQKHGPVPLGENGKQGLYALNPTFRRSLSANKLIRYFEANALSEADAIALCSADLSRVEGFLKGLKKPGQAMIEGLKWLIDKKTSLTMRYNKNQSRPEDKP